MGKETAEAILRVLSNGDIGILDITGGAPELNPHFRDLVTTARKMGIRVFARTNLTVFFEEGMRDLPEFYRDNTVELIASLPCYSEQNVDSVRGKGAFRKSIDALRTLNRLGYGDGVSGLKLHLVYNPGGAFLAPSQKKLEEDYKKQLFSMFGISFDRLYTYANMPLGRFRDHLIRTNGLAPYMKKLEDAFNPSNLDGLMCRHLISVGWDGRLYDCDFNQILGLSVRAGFPQQIRDFDLSKLASREISVGDHCYCCAAGQGST
jgi:radical SAM/Cys-rich protein